MIKSRVCNVLLGLLAIALVAFGTFIVLSNSTSNVASAPAASAPNASAENYPTIGLQLPLQQLDGKWSYKQNGSSFAAVVENNTIAIDLVGEDGTSMTYWAGTFESPVAVDSSVTSNVDASKFVLSQDSTKVFTIGDGTLSFQFQALGMKKNVEMKRG